jgi:uncharacterized membrane protein YdjX (TVP38/TMEM64 family)
MVVESLNKQVSLSSIVTVHVGRDFVTLGNIMCRVALIFDYHKALHMFRYWNGEGGVRIILFARVVPVPYSVKSIVIFYTAVSVCMCMTSVWILLVSPDARRIKTHRC